MNAFDCLYEELMIEIFISHLHSAVCTVNILTTRQ